MATGTEGPDFLTNDKSTSTEVIAALGGDDTITINLTSMPYSVGVDGGDGFDTMYLSGLIWAMIPGVAVMSIGVGQSPLNYISHVNVERLVLDVTAASPDGGQFGLPIPVYLTTGDTIDHITIDSRPLTDVHVSTGGGDDAIFLRNGGFASSVRGGAGDDLIDLTAVTFGDHSAFGEDGDDILLGGTGLDTLDGGPGDDFLSPGAGTAPPSGGASDTALGGEGDDVIYFGARLDGRDRIDGGSGTDRLVLQGDYSLGIVLTGALGFPEINTFTKEMETISVLSASDDSFSEGGGGSYDYVLATRDSAFTAGVQARIDAAGLLAGEDLTFDGSAETDARFLVYAGKGADRVTGGLGNDIFFFGEDGRFAPGDIVSGGGGYDGLFLQGNYSIDFNAPSYSGAIANLENLTLSSASDVRYADAAGTEFDYYIAWADALLGAGQTLTVSGTSLQANETMTFQGIAETDGGFRIFAGAASDLLSGGRGADLIFGGLGGDRMLGNGGNDVFRYDRAAESTSAARDTIRDFTLGDLIDLSRIDADTLASGDQAFSFIGGSAFTQTAGELRLSSQGGPIWLIQGDTDGDGVADFEVSLFVIDSHPVTSADFLL